MRSIHSPSYHACRPTGAKIFSNGSIGGYTARRDQPDNFIYGLEK